MRHHNLKEQFTYYNGLINHYYKPKVQRRNIQIRKLSTFNKTIIIEN